MCERTNDAHDMHGFPFYALHISMGTAANSKKKIGHAMPLHAHSAVDPKLSKIISTSGLGRKL